MLDKRIYELDYMRKLQEKEFVKIDHPEAYIAQKIEQKKYNGLSSIKKQKLEAYGYLVEAVHLLDDIDSFV